MKMEELAEKYTRRELEKIAHDLGISVADKQVYSNKAKIAEAILEARGKGFPLEGVKEMREKGTPKPSIGTRGVMAKQMAIYRLAKEMEDNAKGMLADGAAKIGAGVKELQEGIKAQEEENAKAVSNIGEGAKEILAEVKEFQGSIRAEAKKNAGYIKDFYYG